MWTPLFGGFGSGFGGETSVMFDLEGVLGLPASLLSSISTFSGRFGGGDGLVSAGLHAYAVFTTLSGQGLGPLGSLGLRGGSGLLSPSDLLGSISPSGGCGCLHSSAGGCFFGSADRCCRFDLDAL